MKWDKLIADLQTNMIPGDIMYARCIAALREAQKYLPGGQAAIAMLGGAYAKGIDDGSNTSEKTLCPYINRDAVALWEKGYRSQ